MTEPLEIQFLPANEGDAIWVRWGKGRQLLIDAGKDGAGKRLRARLEDLPKSRRIFELLVVTHVDADHIGGVITSLIDPGPLDGLKFKDLWFNGWSHINGKQPTLEPMGGAQGEILTNWIRDTKTPWNKAFGGGAVVRESPLRRVELADGMAITVLGPPSERFAALIPKWQENVRDAIKKGRLKRVSPGLEAMGRPKPTKPKLATAAALEKLANTRFTSDTAPANGSSICLLLEYGERRVLLTGDAYAHDVVDGLALVKPKPQSIDLVKLAHHGSQNNTSDELVDAVRCRQWVVSTNGTLHFHPDASTIARVLRAKRTPRPQLVFNEPSTYNSWWDDDELRSRFHYKTVMGTPEDGVTVRL
jgi:hypothetical protein